MKNTLCAWMTVAGMAAAAWGATTIVGPNGEETVVYAAGEEPAKVASPVVKEGDTVHFGSVDLDLATKAVTCTGWVNQARGIVEVLACGEEGKVHESVLVLPVNPLDLQAALLLAGHKGGEPMPGFGVGPARGTPVDLWVEWTDTASGDARKARAETFVLDAETGTALEEGPWVFTGSIMQDGEFKALAEETLIATYWDPYAIINNPYASGGNDDILFANPETVPPVGTAIRFTMAPAAADNPKLATEGVGGEGRRRFGF